MVTGNAFTLKAQNRDYNRSPTPVYDHPRSWPYWLPALPLALGQIECRSNLIGPSNTMECGCSKAKLAINWLCAY